MHCGVCLRQRIRKKEQFPLISIDSKNRAVILYLVRRHTRISVFYVNRRQRSCMERERSTARRNSAERNWPTLSPTEQPDRVAGGKSGQKNSRSAVGGGTKKKAGEGGGSGQKKAAGERSGSGQRKASGERSGSGQRKAAGERSGSGQKKAAGEGSRQLKKAQSQPEVMTIRSGMRGTAYTNSGQEGRNQGYSRTTGGQNRAQGHSAASGGRNRAQSHSTAAGDQSREPLSGRG